MKKRNILRLLPLLLAAALLLGSCAEKGADTPAPETQTAPEPETTPVSEPESASEPDESTFTYEENADGAVTLTGYTGAETVLTIPATLGGKKVTAIGESAFAGNIHLEKVYVPEGVTSLGDYAFECCSVLKKAYLPETLETIGSGAFSGCQALYLLDLQDNVTAIGKGAFLDCTSLVSFVAPKALTTLGEFAFADCSTLMSVEMRDSSLAAVPDRLFYACGALSTVRLPETVTSVGKRAFSGNESLRYLYLPEACESVGSYAFENCASLQNFDFPCDEVAPHTFTCCSALSYVSFPETLKAIGEGAFHNVPLKPEDLEISENANIAPLAFDPEEEPPYVEETLDESAENDIISLPEADITVDEISAAAADEGYQLVKNEEFAAWAEEYLAFNADNALLDQDLNPYITKYKGEIGYYYQAMTAVASGNVEDIEAAKVDFGDDFEEMYRMIDHGLATEISRFRMENDMLLYTGVYDCQLMAAAGTDHVPTLDELKAKVGSTFTDPCLTSTTTEAEVAFGFSDTLFVIYAPAENLNALGAVCMDSYMHTPENEILLNSGATYEILGAGVLSDVLTDWDGNETTESRAYVMLKLINE